MQNQVTVILSLPWMTDLSKADWDKLYRQISEVARDTKNASYPEANRLLSALTVKRSKYDYETDAGSVRFKPYAVLSELLPDKSISVRVTKVGPHIQSGTKSDVTYYNAIQADCVSGKMTSQMIGHVEHMHDDRLTDTVKLSGSSMCQTLSMLKETALSEASKHDKAKQNDYNNLPLYQSENGLSL